MDELEKFKEQIDAQDFKLKPGKVIDPISDIAFKNIFKDREHR